jgi:hypothetical protein
MLNTLFRRTVICQSFAGVWLTGMTSLGAVSHNFNFNFKVLEKILRRLLPLCKWSVPAI